jgi:hypothetical protein
MEGYCGIKPLKKGQKRATALECLKNNQVRYYGIKKIDKDLIKEVVVEKEQEKIKEQIRVNQVSIRALNKTGEKLIKDIDRYESKKYLKERLEIFETEKQKTKEEKRIKTRLEEIKEEGRKLSNKLKKLVKDNELLTKSLK